MAGIDRQISDRMMMGEQALQQRYAQSQELIDLLALQALSKEKDEKARAIQASMQANPATVRDQLEQKNLAANRQGIASMMPGVQMQGKRMQQAQARQMAGIPSQSAPNMARMAGGGIVAFQEGGMARSDAESIAYDMLAIERQMRKPDKTEEELKQLDTRRMELSARMANDPTGNLRADVYKTMDVIRAGGADRLHLNNTIQQMPIGGFTAKLINYLRDGGYKPEDKEDDAFVGPTKDMLKGMYGGGIVGYAPGGSVGPEVDDFARALRAEGISDPKLAKFLESLYGQESSYGTNARPSSSGARGGMQIMPGTFAEVADEDMDINDSLDAMRAGMRYGKRAFSAAGGDPAAARAYYYGGPGGLAAYMAGKDRNTEDPDFPSVREDVEKFMSTYYPEPKKESASAPNGLSVQEARDIVAADDVGVIGDLFGAGYKRKKRDAAFAVLKDAGYTRAQIERMRMGGETSDDMQSQITDYSQLAAELEAEIADRERFGGDTSFQRAELADLTRAIDTTKDVASITPDLEKTYPEASEEDIQALFDALKTPTAEGEPAEIDADADAGKPKRKVDYDLLREYLAGGAGATSIAGALSGGSKALGAELSRREARDLALAEKQADRDLKKLALDYELNAANAKILADNQRVLTEAQMEIAAETLKSIEAGTNMAYLEAIKKLQDEYEGEILEEKIAELKQDTIRSAVGAATSLGNIQTTGDVISTTRISE